MLNNDVKGIAMRIFDRSEDLGTLSEAFGESARGNGRLVIVTGGPGSGKTELIHEFLTMLGGTSAHILAGTANAADQDRPMSLIRQLTPNGGMACEASDGARPAGGSGEELPRLGVHGRKAAETVRQETAEALLRLAGEERPLVVAVDDAHLMDRASLGALVRLLRHSRFRRVLVVCATEGRSGAGGVDVHAELIRQPHRRVRLAPLSERGVGALLAAQAGRVLPGNVGRAYHRATAGSPLLVHALLD
ncbi:ATP-binding protein, partial [Streptomyces minutiscleroticus]|uniref:ATP-binding protein n=1 Tax=Streptomyces minutiscleroticus TaxID=68238 RepID=UPI001E5647B6